MTSVRRLIHVWLIALAAGLLFGDRLLAHPVSLTRSFVHVTQEKVTVKIEVFLEDLFMFHNLKPSDQDFLEPDVIGRGIEKHKQFLLERFVIRDVKGERIAGRRRTASLRPHHHNAIHHSPAIRRDTNRARHRPDHPHQTNQYNHDPHGYRRQPPW